MVRQAKPHSSSAMEPTKKASSTRLTRADKTAASTAERPDTQQTGPRAKPRAANARGASPQTGPSAHTQPPALAVHSPEHKSWLVRQTGNQEQAGCSCTPVTLRALPSSL